MQCPKCQTENPEINKFCRECGTELILVCPQCKSEIQANDRFCGQCGHNLVETSASAQLPKSKEENDISAPSDESVSFTEGERRQATIVFSDLSGYTSMNEQLDPEEVEAIMKPCALLRATRALSTSSWVTKFWHFSASPQPMKTIRSGQ